MINDRDEQIRARAYQIWEEEGRPEGHEQEHWLQASQEMEGQPPTDEGVNAGASSGLQPGGTLPAGGDAGEASVGTGGADTVGSRK